MTATETPNITAELRDAGLRVTAARVALLQTVRAGNHLGVDAIAAGVRRRVGHISLQAVYEALHAMTAAGLVRRIEPAGSPARFEGRTGDNHHHLVCRSCGAVADVDCAVGHPPCLDPVDDAGFHVDEADVTFWGLCPRCRPDAATPDAAPPDAAPTEAAPTEAAPTEAATTGTTSTGTATTGTTTTNGR